MKSFYEKCEQKANELAEELREKGYSVNIQPQRDSLPFTLENYQPDIIATKGTEGLIIEIKSSAKRVSIDKFQSISNEISKHEGWRFILVTLDDEGIDLFSYSNESLPSRDEINERKEEVEQLITIGMFDAALLYLWSTLESCLRILALNTNIPVERLAFNKLSDHLYSNGELSIDQHEYLKQIIVLRNQAAHGFNTEIQADQLNTGVKILEDLNTRERG
ncbi:MULTISPECIES: hypothetical protein [unclassified Endozoicomonas]|uniref:hypothetical protein n=1 Tax=unclassified Endozoicomonas TaxID=2644528 RepID=UPI003BB51BA8